jgi:hypothetical protein
MGRLLAWWLTIATPMSREIGNKNGQVAHRTNLAITATIWITSFSQKE